MEAVTIGGLALFAFLGVSFYNQNVNLASVIADRKEELKILLAANADLKNRLYELTDSKNLEPLILKMGLIKVSRPEYLETQSRPGATTFHGAEVEEKRWLD